MDSYSHETNFVRLGYVLTFIALFLNYGTSDIGIVAAVLTFVFAYLGEHVAIVKGQQNPAYGLVFALSSLSCVISYLCWLVSTFA